MFLFLSFSLLPNWFINNLFFSCLFFLYLLSSLLFLSPVCQYSDKAVAESKLRQDYLLFQIQPIYLCGEWVMRLQVAEVGFQILKPHPPLYITILSLIKIIVKDIYGYYILILQLSYPDLSSSHVLSLHQSRCSCPLLSWVFSSAWPA